MSELTEEELNRVIDNLKDVFTAQESIKWDRLVHHIHMITTERNALKRQVEAMTPVVEAAVDAETGFCLRTTTDRQYCDALDRTWAATRAYIAADEAQVWKKGRRFLPGLKAKV